MGRQGCYSYSTLSIMRYLLFILSAFLMLGCAHSIRTRLTNPEKKYPPLEAQTEIFLLDMEDNIPSDSEPIGEIKIGDGGLAVDCGYEKAIQELINASKQVGANLIRIVEVKAPSPMGSSCYRLRATIFRNLNQESLEKMKEKIAEANKSTLPPNCDYAMIYFYRPTSNIGYAIGYKVKDEQKNILGRLRNGEKFAYKIQKFGNQSFVAETEAQEIINLNIEKGKEYFVRCGIRAGTFIGRPFFVLIENRIGRREYRQMN